MSSSFTEGPINDSKLIVHIAENGRSLEINCDETTVVESVMSYVESVSGIGFNDQLVLCLGMRLKPSHPLSEYKLPAADKEVFIFNKTRLQSNSPPPPLEQADVIEEPAQEPLPVSHDPHPLDDVSDPALKALPSYERQFRHHYHRGHAIYCKTLVNYENCEKLVKEQKVQEKALLAGRVNLEQYYRMILQSYNEFIKRYTQQHKIHLDLLTNFTRYLDKLRSVKLHPSLQTSSRKCLMDFIKEDNLRNSLENCTNSHRQFEKKVSEFKQMFGDVKHKVEELFSWKPPFSIKNLEIAIKENQRFINEQKSIMQSLSKDVNTVKKLIEECLSCQLYPSLRPHDAVSALGPMYDVHDKTHIPKMQACERSISKLLEFCIDKKNEMNFFVHSYMQKITYISYVIKDVKLQFPVFREAMMRQEDLFIDLKVVRGIGAAYRACLAEVVRRKASKKLYMGLAGQLAEKLATKRDAEIMKREEFLKGNIVYIPKDVLASLGLYDTPSQCDINIASFDDHLLDIEMSDVSRYAPDSLVGFPLKFDVEETSENEDSFDVLDEIAGTSKVELENAKLKAELASAIALLCSLSGDVDTQSLDVSKTTEALMLKDEYAKHLQCLLKSKQDQCLSYEKRIQELEERLSEHSRCKDKISTGREGNMQYGTTLDLMEEVSCISTSLDEKLDLFAGETSKSREGIDETMLDSSLMQNIPLDSSMPEPTRDKDSKDKTLSQLGMSLTNSSTAENIPVDCDILLNLQTAISEKSKQLSEIEVKLNSALDENSLLTSELEKSRKLLDESQMNCAHLESCLHEAREEAQTHLCASDRRASEYRALRESAVKMHTLFERFRKCVYASGGVAGFVNEIRALAQSLASSINENEDDAASDFRNCIQVLSDRINFLSRHRQELLEKFPKLESVNEQIRKELEEKDLRYREKQKQTKEEMIRISHLELQEKAAFVLNSAGHYQAINKNCSNYYLSSASVSLFTDHLPALPSYIIGLVVHIERQTVKPLPDHQLTPENMGSSSLNPYGLPIGCEYFVVTIAMIPDTASIHSLSPS